MYLMQAFCASSSVLPYSSFGSWLSTGSGFELAWIFIVHIYVSFVVMSGTFILYIIIPIYLAFCLKYLFKLLTTMPA